MIRLLTENDHTQIMDLIEKESELNLFIIGDIENFGYDKDFQKMWGQFDEENRLIAILLKYYENSIFYSRDPYDVEGFARILKNEGCSRLGGEKIIIAPFKERLNISKEREAYLCKLDHEPMGGTFKLSDPIEKLGPEDAEAIVTLYASIDEFENSDQVDRIRNRYADQSSRGYGIFKKGDLIAVAQTTAENSKSAMIIGVCTHPSYRKKSYASMCMFKLCKELLDEEKTLCLHYNNPEAGRIYKRLGFKDIGMWRTFTF